MCWKLYGSVIEIELLYISQCPNRTVARDHIDRALARARLSAVVREREVQSGEEAAHLGMRGSPTILVDGRDPFVETADSTALSCRLYRSEVGFSGAPTVEQLVEALGKMRPRLDRPSGLASPTEPHGAGGH